jgi:hypothetical protein
MSSTTRRTPEHPPASALAITLDRAPFALRSTRNRLRTAVRRGASWTAAYRRQLTVAAVARPVRGRVGAPASLLLSGPGGCSPRRRLPRGASSHSRAVGRCRRGRPGQQARHGVGRRCPAGGVHPSGLGVRGPAVRPSGVRSPGVAVQRVRRSAVCCPSVRCPAVWCLPSSVRTRPSPPTQAVAVGTRSRWPGDPDHRNGWRPLWRVGRRRLDRRSRRPRRGRRCRRRVGQGGPVADPGRRVGCGPRRPRLPAERPGRPGGVRSAPSRAAARWAGGAGCSARWRQPPRGCRPRAGCLTTLGGRRRA